jgi:type IV pilus assembly protein PilX
MSGHPKLIQSAPNQQRGATLIIALVFMAALTLLGATAAQNSGLEERMASNTHNRDLAFQAAEAALKYVQLNLSSGDNLRSLNYAGSTAGLSTFNVNHADDSTYWGTTFVWNDTTARHPTDTITQVASQPYYIVEKMPNVGTTEYYRVTARGVGGDANAVVILQAAYTYTP